jgi:ATP-dependent DNA ligase
MERVMKAWQILDEVAAVKGSKAKKELLLNAKEDLGVGLVLADFFKYCTDPFITFGITMDEEEFGGFRIGWPETSQCILWTKWIVLLDRLRDREITGNAAKHEVACVVKLGGKGFARWAIPMLNRDIRMGVGQGTLKKVFPGLIDKFECQLAAKWDEETVPENATVEPKYDGVRGHIFVSPTSGCFALSRNGKPLNNVSHVIDELVTCTSCTGVWDGEFFNEDWSKSISAVRSGEKGDTSSRFRAFDFLTKEEWDRKRVSMVLRDRQEFVRTALKMGDAKFSTFIPGIPVTTPEDVQRAADYWVERGYEGGMLKDLDAPYQFGRGSKKDPPTWLKVKPWDSTDVEILGFEIGKKGTKNGERLGAFVTQYGNVGAMGDDVRDEVWADKEKFLGKIIEVKHQGFTPDGQFRFPSLTPQDGPTFYRFRPDKDE